MSEYKLTQEIIQRSQEKTWDLARLEWELDTIYEAENPEKCLCGHFPIIEICILRNKINRQQATVGNCCVKKFIGLPSDLIFQAVKRVRMDKNKSLNAEALLYAYNKNWIDKWEFNFSIDIMRKRNLSSRQLQIRMKVNAKMLFNMKYNNLKG